MTARSAAKDLGDALRAEARAGQALCTEDGEVEEAVRQAVQQVQCHRHARSPQPLRHRHGVVEQRVQLARLPHQTHKHTVRRKWAKRQKARAGRRAASRPADCRRRAAATAAGRAARAGGGSATAGCAPPPASRPPVRAARSGWVTMAACLQSALRYHTRILLESQHSSYIIQLAKQQNQLMQKSKLKTTTL